MVIDITTFRLADGTTDAEFLELDDRVRTGTLYQRRGILRSTTARADDGGWAVIVLWWDADAADNTVLVELLTLADSATVERRRYTTFD